MKKSEQNFLPGLELCRRFYAEAVAPVLARKFPELRYSAARLGSGSEVLGYDTIRSTDHDWGPRLQLFVNEDDFQTSKDLIDETLRMQLPKEVHGYSTHFGPADEEGTRLPASTEGPIDHRVEIWTIPSFFEIYMAYDTREDPTPLEWLTWPQQHLLGVTTGAVYQDDLGELTVVRQKLSYYSRDVWLYLLAAQWSRIGQEEHFVGRTGEAREEHLCAAYEMVANRHNALGITEPLETKVRYFHGRPFRIIDADRFVKVIKAQIEDPLVAGIATDIGSIDQFSHSTGLRSQPRLHKRLQSLYK